MKLKKIIDDLSESQAIATLFVLMIIALAVAGVVHILDFYIEADPAAGTDIFESDEILTSLAIPAIDGNKMEPGNSQ